MLDIFLDIKKTDVKRYFLLKFLVLSNIIGEELDNI